VRAALDSGLDDLPETLRQNLGPALQIGAETALFGANLVSRDNERNETDSDNQRKNQAQAESHSGSLTAVPARKRQVKGFSHERRIAISQSSR
jgi:hypothetical protein